MRSTLAFVFLFLLFGCRTSNPFEFRFHNKPVEVPIRTVGRSDGSISWALDRIDQRTLPLDNKLQHQNTGAGVTIYVFDGGVLADHPDLKGRVRRGFDSLAFCDAHGTSVADAAAGKDFGVALQAEIVDVTVFDTCPKKQANFNEFIQRLKRAVDWVIEDHKKTRRPSVANWSFFIDSMPHSEINELVRKLVRDSITVVVSAGNLDLNACHLSPGGISEAITVSSSYIEIDSVKNGLTFNSDWKFKDAAFGSCVDLYAPGVNVILASFDDQQVPTYQTWFGTSMATGFVSGAAALYLETHPLASPEDVSSQLKCLATQDVVSNTPDVKDTRLLYIKDVNARCELTGNTLETKPRSKSRLRRIMETIF
jgi:subtilisin family serine protease